MYPEYDPDNQHTIHSHTAKHDLARFWRCDRTGTIGPELMSWVDLSHLPCIGEDTESTHHPTVRALEDCTSVTHRGRVHLRGLVNQSLWHMIGEPLFLAPGHLLGTKLRLWSRYLGAGALSGRRRLEAYGSPPARSRWSGSGWACASQR